MSLTSQYDPGNRAHTALCGRTRCSGADVTVHQAGAHLDQRSEFYDGPSSTLQATSLYIRSSARKIITDAPALMPEVMDLVNYVEFMRTQVAHVQVDRDRGIREAQARSESCEHHGAEIKALGEQVHAFSEGERRHNAGRVAVLGLLHAVDELVRQHEAGRLPGLTVDKLVAALAESAKKTHAAHDRAWKS